MTKLQKLNFGSFDDYATNLIKLCNSLKDLGAHYDLRLPGIVVCGNQSAGKSSVIEAIARVPLPRSEGTCTRCPFECRLADAETKWECQVSLRFEYDAKGNKLPKPEEVQFGDVLREASEVQERVMRAQKAVLNFGQDVKSFVTEDLKTLQERVDMVKFTTNTVCLSIQGPGVGNLTLTDLPGIIQSTVDGEDVYINLIKNMVEKYISIQSNIIVEVITCKDDLENQIVHTYAKAADPAGTRTVGVLTKPDMIEEGCHEYWLNVVGNKVRPLTHGYYVVKNSSKKQLDKNIAFEEARSLENDFFSDESPWKEQGNLMSRFGVANLKNFLSGKLIEVLRQVLPGMKSEAASKLLIAQNELRDIPSVMGHPMSESMKLIADLVTDFTFQVTDIHQNAFWIDVIQDLQNFKQDILLTQPLFDGEEMDQNDELKSKDGLHTGINMSLVEVKQHIEKNRGRTLSSFLPYAAVLSILEQVSENWNDYAQSLLEVVGAKALKTAKIVVKSKFERYQGMQTLIDSVFEETFTEIKSECSSQLKRLALIEKSSQFTLNDHYITSNKQKELGKKSSSQAVHDLPQSSQTCLTSASNSLNQAGFKLKSQDVLNLLTKQKISFDDQCAYELIATVKSYWKVAQKRFVDTVCMSVDYSMTKMFASSLNDKLFSVPTKLQAEELVFLMSEDVNIAQRRTELNDQVERLKAAIKRLDGFKF